MALQEPVAAAELRLTVMAALSEGQRLSAHPADIRRRLGEAARITLAIEAKFMVSARQDTEAHGAASGVLLTAES